MRTWKSSHIILTCLLSFPFAGCGSDDGGGSSPTPTVAIPPTATPLPATPTARPATVTHTPLPTPTIGGELDIAICAPGRGPFSATIDNPFFPLPVGDAVDPDRRERRGGAGSRGDHVARRTPRSSLA